VEHGLYDIDLHGPEFLWQGSGRWQSLRQVYSLAAVLTGTSQLLALVGAPIVGRTFDRKLIAVITSLVEILGFTDFGAMTEYPHGPSVFVFSMHPTLVAV